MSKLDDAPDASPITPQRLRELADAIPGFLAVSPLRRAADEIERLRTVLCEVRRDVIESADDVVWMRGGIETVVDRITDALDDAGAGATDG